MRLPSGNSDRKLFHLGVKLISLLLVLCMITFALGCAAGDGDSSDDPSDGGDSGGDGGDGGGSSGTSSVINLEEITDVGGTAEVSFKLPSGTTKFSLTAIVAGSQVRIDSVTNGDGQEFVTPGGDSISFSNQLLAGANSATVPSRSTDTAVDGGSFTARATARTPGGGSISNQELDFTVNTKVDNDLSSGVLHINLFYVGSVAQTPAAKQAMQSAIEQFRTLYGAGAGLSLDIISKDIDGPAVAPDPLTGDTFFLNAAATGVSPGVNIFAVGDVANLEGEVLGVSGGIPTPPIPTVRSGVVISVVTGAGPDGSFDGEDLRFLGETLAHETGHSMGLFHPVDFSGDRASDFDPLSDTPTCQAKSDCEANPQLNANLMYEEPVLDPNGSGAYLAQSQLSLQQRGVLNRYIAVD